MKTIMIIFFFFAAITFYAQGHETVNYFITKSEKEIADLNRTDYFKGKTVNEVIDTFGNNYSYLYYNNDKVYASAVIVYEYKESKFIIVNCILGEAEYFDRNLVAGYYDIEELIKEEVASVSISLKKIDRDSLESIVEMNLKRMEMALSEIFLEKPYLYKYEYNKLLTEHSYYLLTNVYIFDHLKGIKLKLLFDIIGNNFYGYNVQNWKDGKTIYYVDFWYKFKDDTDICLSIYFKNRINIQEATLDKLFEAYTESIYVYLLPPTKLSTLIKVSNM